MDSFMTSLQNRMFFHSLTPFTPGLSGKITKQEVRKRKGGLVEFGFTQGKPIG